jgi:hypothetical protein
MKLLLIFIALNIINVILQTVKSIMTIRCGKTIAAIANAVAYALYTVVLVYMSCDLSTLAKALVVGGCNLIGVYIVKSIEEKTNKEKIWKIEFTIPLNKADEIINDIQFENFSYNEYEIDEKYSGVNIYAYTKEDSAKAKKIVDKYNIKYFVTESKAL